MADVGWDVSLGLVCVNGIDLVFKKVSYAYL